VRGMGGARRARGVRGRVRASEGHGRRWAPGVGRGVACGALLLAQVPQACGVVVRAGGEHLAVRREVEAEDLGRGRGRDEGQGDGRDLRRACRAVCSWYVHMAYGMGMGMGMQGPRPVRTTCIRLCTPPAYHVYAHAHARARAHAHVHALCAVACLTSNPNPSPNPNPIPNPVTLTLTCLTCPCSSWMALPERRSHRRMRQSSPAVATREPSGWNAMP